VFAVAFKMFDHNDTGFVNRDDLEKLLFSLSAVMNRAVEIGTVKEIVEDVMKVRSLCSSVGRRSLWVPRRS